MGSDISEAAVEVPVVNDHHGGDSSAILSYARNHRILFEKNFSLRQANFPTVNKERLRKNAPLQENAIG